jgi:hypothetical protein
MSNINRMISRFNTEASGNATTESMTSAQFFFNNLNSYPVEDFSRDIHILIAKNLAVA